MPILGLHHVTATVDDAQDDLDFCLDGLGLRLVKKTVNFDNHFVYHFYYGGDERGTPGTIWTTFPYKGHGVRVGGKGAGQVTVTSFSVPTGSLDFWRLPLGARAISGPDLPPRLDEPGIGGAGDRLRRSIRAHLRADRHRTRRPAAVGRGGIPAGACDPRPAQRHARRLRGVANHRSDDPAPRLHRGRSHGRPLPPRG